MGKFPIYLLGIEIDNEMNLKFNLSFFMVNCPWKIRKNVVRIKEPQGVIFCKFFINSQILSKFEKLHDTLYLQRVVEAEAVY